jgi:hypothetical protein
MSEIVRPTRDGIHGREYISTSVDIGARPMRLKFTSDGKMLTPPSRLLELQIPAILDMPAWPVDGDHLASARAIAAKELKSLAIMPVANASAAPSEQLPFVVPVLMKATSSGAPAFSGRTDGGSADCGCGGLAANLHAVNPKLFVAVRMLLQSAATCAVELARAPEGFHLCADRTVERRRRPARLAHHDASAKYTAVSKAGCGRSHVDRFRRHRPWRTHG